MNFFDKDLLSSYERKRTAHLVCTSDFLLRRLDVMSRHPRATQRVAKDLSECGFVDIPSSLTKASQDLFPQDVQVVCDHRVSSASTGGGRGGDRAMGARFRKDALSEPRPVIVVPASRDVAVAKIIHDMTVQPSDWGTSFTANVDKFRISRPKSSNGVPNLQMVKIANVANWR